MAAILATETDVSNSGFLGARAPNTKTATHCFAVDGIKTAESAMPRHRRYLLRAGAVGHAVARVTHPRKPIFRPKRRTIQY